jgi:hypothetical protein
MADSSVVTRGDVVGLVVSWHHSSHRPVEHGRLINVVQFITEAGMLSILAVSAMFVLVFVSFFFNLLAN